MNKNVADIKSIKEIITCELCELVLDSPINLPCFKVICKSHVSNLQKNKSKETISCICKNEHQIPKNGFKSNPKIESLINSNAFYNETELEFRNEFNNSISSLNILLLDFEKQEIEDEALIYDKVGDLKNKIDIYVERLKLKADQERDSFFKKIKSFENELTKKQNELKKKQLKNQTVFDEIKTKWSFHKRQPNIKTESNANLKSELDETINEVKQKCMELDNLRNSINNFEFLSDDDLLNRDQIIGKLVENTANENTSQTDTEVKNEDFVTIRAKVNNKYVCVDKSDERLTANQSSINNSSIFKIYMNNDNTVSFQSMLNRKYVSAELFGFRPLKASKSAVCEGSLSWEKFILKKNANGTVSLRTLANYLYVCAENFGNGPLISNRNLKNLWEQFYIDKLPNEKITNDLVKPEECTLM